jgi:hypothetical protein
MYQVRPAAAESRFSATAPDAAAPLFAGPGGGGAEHAATSAIDAPRIRWLGFPKRPPSTGALDGARTHASPPIR